MTKSKIRNRKSFTAAEREHRLHHHLYESRNTMHVFRHSGSPDQAVLIGRSLLPMLVSRIYVVMTSKPQCGLSIAQQLEEIRLAGVISNPQLERLRDAAGKLGEIAHGRDAKDVAAACDELIAIVRSGAFREARKRPETPRKATDRRWLPIRWAAAACGLVGLGGAP
ncbi:MAG: hypothetical protein AAFV88_18305 [Planctomycetota bacterium]